MKVLLLVYACEPNAGSEPGTGWNTALHLAKSHQVTVVTRSNNRGRIESALRELTGPLPEFVYYDLPPVLVSLKKKTPRNSSLLRPLAIRAFPGACFTC